jgi:hypothetical protein
LTLDGSRVQGFNGSSVEHLERFERIEPFEPKTFHVNSSALRD